MVINPNWPVLLYEWGPFWNVNGGTQPLDSYVEISARTRGRAGVQRGRQYELDQVRSGTLDVALRDSDGSLSPLNQGGPWYGHIGPYQPARARAQWPPTQNLLTQVQATGGDLGGYPAGPIPLGQQGISVLSTTDSSGGTITASATAWQGGYVFQFAVPATATAGQWPCWTRQVPPEPGTAYSEQLQVRNVTASTTVQVQAVVSWKTAGGATISTVTGSAVTLTGSATAAWTQVTVTGTAPVNSAVMSIGLQLAGAPSAACSVQVDGWQVEKAAAPTPWVAPGVWYWIWSGWVERWPTKWTFNGTYTLVNPTMVDTFSLLSQRQLRDPLTEEIYSRNPRFLYTLSDPQNSQSFADAIGAFAPAPLAVSKYGAGSVTSGNQITSATSGGIYTGSTGTVVTVANASPGTNLIAAATFISLSSAGVKGPADPTNWSRMIAFRYTGPTPSAGGNAVLWSAMDLQGVAAGGSRINIGINPSGSVYATVGGPGNNLATGSNSNVNVLDGNWHLVIVSYNVSVGFLQVAVDNTGVAFTVASVNSPTGMVSDCVGGFVDASVGNGTTNNYQGDLAFVAEFPGFLYFANDVQPLYGAWKNSFAGDSSDARYKRILGWAGYSGPTAIQAGRTTSMGPAATGGQDVLSALQAVVDTEAGVHYTDRTGALTFKARSDRYNRLTPMYVFGENAGAGELPYEDCELDLDPTHLANMVKVTQATTSQLFSAQSTTSIGNYFPRQLARTVNSNSSQECQDAANYLLSRYRTPATRVTLLKLHPSANPSVLWPVCLSLELGTRIRVMRRPPAPAPAIQVDCFVENIVWELGDDGNAFVTLQCSPVDLTPYGLFASFHSTLAGSGTIAAGTNPITINAGMDTTNPAAAQIGPGQQLVLGEGTATQETVTVQSVAATSPGWSTVAVTLTAATANAHTAGDTVCEPLPSGVTDPTTWDPSAKFDSIAFSY